MAFSSLERIDLFIVSPPPPPPPPCDVKVHLAVIGLSLLEAAVKGIVAESIPSVYFPLLSLNVSQSPPLTVKTASIIGLTAAWDWGEVTPQGYSSCTKKTGTGRRSSLPPTYIDGVNGGVSYHRGGKGGKLSLKTSEATLGSYGRGNRAIR